MESKEERRACEEKIAEKIQEIMDIYLEYEPDGDYLAIGIYSKDRTASVGNDHWTGLKKVDFLLENFSVLST